MKRSLPSLVLLLSLASSLSAESLIYRETSGGKTTQETATLTRSTSEGLLWETISGKDSTVRSARTPEGSLVAVEIDSPEGRWSLKVQGDLLKASGVYQGKPLSGTLALKGRLWSSGFDQPLRWAVLHQLKAPLLFLMAGPDVANSREMVLTPDGKDTVSGKPALRFKLGLPGAMALFWGATIWADPVTGEQVQYKGNKGPNTPEVLLVIDRQG